MFLVAGTVFAQTGPSQESMDAALKDLSELYGSPVVRVEQAKAICNQEQYVIECAGIGKKHGLYQGERIKQVDSLLAEIKGKTLESLKACGDVDCLVEVATTLAKQLAEDNPQLARALDLTPQKVQEKRTIVEAARSVGVDIEECQSMDPDNASLELLRACAKLAKHKNVQKYIPTEDREKTEKSDNMIAFKEALAKGEFSCGDGTIEGCGAFCLNPSAEARGAGVSAIPPICSQIATRFFGPEGQGELQRAYENVRETVNIARERFLPPSERRGATSTQRMVCPDVSHTQCPVGEYRQESRNESGCFIEGECIPINTKTQREESDGRFICPALPTLNECAEGEEKIISFSSPECGTYYSCVPGSSRQPDATYPYTFQSGRVVTAFEETRMYCYESGFGGATERGDKNECEQMFHFSIPDMPPEKQGCSRYGADWKAVDESGNCFDQAGTQYLGPNGVLRQCAERPIFGCNAYNTTRPEPPGGQREQVWNSRGLRSWVLAGASSAKIETLKSACANTPSGANIWMPEAGNQSSENFGMPDPDKCRRAAACTTSQYFDGASCVSGTTPPDTITSGSCSATLIGLLGDGCHTMGNAWFNSEMTSYVMPGTQTVKSCTADYISGCTSWSNTQSCPTDQYWNSNTNACVSSTAGGGSIQRCFYPNATKNGASVGYTVWCESDYVNCHEGSPSGTSVSTSGLSLGAPSSCESGWSSGGGSSSCPSGQYWSGTRCLPSDNTVTGSCSSELTSMLGSGCHTMGNAWFNSEMTSYVMPGTQTVKSCTADYISGCSGGSTGGTTGSDNYGSCGSYASQSSCTSAPNCSWYSGSSPSDSSYCYYQSSGTSSSCPSGQYWNGSACVSSSDGDTSSAQSGCASAGGTWDSSANYCRMPSSSSCGSGQYWNGSACVNTSTTDCTSGQYWNGSACVSSSDGDTSSAQSGCASAGGTWDSSANYCRMPSSSAGQKPLAFACPEAHVWEGSYCIIAPRSNLEALVANALSALMSLIKN